MRGLYLALHRLRLDWVPLLLTSAAQRHHKRLRLLYLRNAASRHFRLSLVRDSTTLQALRGGLLVYLKPAVCAVEVWVSES